MDNKLYVGNLSYSTTEDELRALFGQAGSVTSVQIIKDRDTGRSKGFAFVEMGNRAEAQEAIRKFNAFSLNDRELTVNIARPREERPFGGGGGGFDRRSSNRGRDRRGGGRRRF
jgi:RNA recognition motif-containing protein